MLMSMNRSLDLEIEYLKSVLTYMAAQYKYELNHPRVVEVSQQLDGLIVERMKKRAAS
ncbi:aspartyl-phosphate phosphatase Spo0E family protein [Paenibacillus sp. 1P03SA]|uniref:aspartyl-phosphate phosphatase Spo0E family protein n=1 Tax=Paenibacillus sp. 1P03SA TaxID=3132294 RepID=UPI0039A21B6C